MVNVSIENIDFEKNTLKDAIIKILSYEYPLSAKIIYNKIRKQNNFQVSYQAVYKAMSQLVEKGILTKEKATYSINKEWINNLEHMIKILKKSYEKNQPLRLFSYEELSEEPNQTILEFEDLYSADTYRKRLQKEFFNKTKNEIPYCGQSKHLKSPLIYSEKSLKLLEKIKSNQSKAYILVEGNSKIDEYCANYYRNQNIKVKTNIKFEFDSDIMILGDLIIQQYIAADLKTYLNEIYKKHDINDIDVKDLFKNFYNKKSNVKFIITNNKELAQTLRTNILKEFKEPNQVKSSAIFDFDGVLYKGFSILDYLKYLTKEQLFNEKYLNKFEAEIINYKNKKISYKCLAKRVIPIYGKGLIGEKQSKIKKAANNFTSEIKDKNYFEYTKNLLKILKNNKKLTLITGSPMEMIEAMNKDLGFNEIYATELVVENDTYTGKIKTDLGRKEGKTKIIEKYFKNNSQENSIGFGDTQSDIAFLDKVTHPIAINPNEILKKHAEEQENYTILYKNMNIIKEVEKILNQ